MQRLQVAILSLLTVAVVVLGALILVAQRRSDERLEQLACFERAHVTAAIAVMVPESRLDVEGRLEAVRTLGAQIDAC